MCNVQSAVFVDRVVTSYVVGGRFLMKVARLMGVGCGQWTAFMYVLTRQATRSNFQSS